jgi:hypothetical protein
MTILADPDAELGPWEYARLASLAFYGARTVARLMRDHKALNPNSLDEFQDCINRALDLAAEDLGIEL